MERLIKARSKTERINWYKLAIKASHTRSGNGVNTNLRRFSSVSSVVFRYTWNLSIPTIHGHVLPPREF